MIDQQTINKDTRSLLSQVAQWRWCYLDDNKVGEPPFVQQHVELLIIINQSEAAAEN